MADSVVTVILKSTIAWLSDKGLNLSAEKLKQKDGVVDQQLCPLIARELKGAILNDSLKEIIDLYSGGVGIISFAEEVKANNRSGVISRPTVGTDAKRQFALAREKAAIVFDASVGSLAIADRLLAMYFFVKATLFEQIDSPADALASCIQCLEELHSMREVKNSFSLELHKSPLKNSSLDKVYNPAQIISSVRRVNQVVFDVAQLVGTEREHAFWPSVKIGRDRIYPLHELRLGKKLRDQNIEVCSEKWSFGELGENGTKPGQDIVLPSGIATNSKGHFLVADVTKMKVYNNSGNYLHSISLPRDAQFRFDQTTDEELLDSHVFYDDPYLYDILDIDTDREDNVYLLVSIASERDHKPKKEHWYQVFVFDKEGAQRRDRTFKLKENSKGRKLAVRSHGGKSEVLVLEGGKDEHAIVEVYNAEAGTFICYLGDRILMNALDVTAASNGRVYVLDKFHDDDGGKCVHEFSRERNLVRSFGVDPDSVAIAFGETSEHIVIVSSLYDPEKCVFQQNVSIYDSSSTLSDNSYIDSKLLRAYEVDAVRILLNLSITVSPEGLIAIALAQDFVGEARGKVVVMRDTKEH